MEFMGEYYGERHVEIRNPMDEEKVSIAFNFDQLKEIPCSIDLDAGASSYWSEIASMQTLDNLLMQGKISTVDYLKRLPAGQITDRETLIAALQAAQGAPAGAAAGGTEEDAAALRGGSGNSTLTRKINETGQIPKER
jgi:hypothetical protein